MAEMTDTPQETPRSPDALAQDVIDEAKALVRLVEEVESEDREAARVAQRFKAGQDHWPAAVVQARESGDVPRPCLVINEILALCTQVSVEYKQNRPGIQVQPKSLAADARGGELREGLLREIQARSSGQQADELAFDAATDIGWGYFVLSTEYESDTSFDQQIVYECVLDPLSVYFDPYSKAVDGSDATGCVLVGQQRRRDFEREYPDAQATNTSLIGTEAGGTWLTPDSVAVARYYCLEYLPDTLLQLGDGQILFASQLQQQPQLLHVGVVRQRPVQRKVVKYYKLTAVDVLEEQTLPGPWLPVVPIYGSRHVVEGRLMKHGIIKPLQDVQVMLNYWASTALELFAQQPRAPYIGPEGFMTGHEPEWRRANDSTIVALEYATMDTSGAPITQAPTRQPPPVLDAGVIAQEDRARLYMHEISGIIQPVPVTPGSDRSAASLRTEKAQSAMSTFHLTRNAQASLLHAARIALAWMPTYYDAQRVIRVIGPDGKATAEQINTAQVDAQGVQQILHDMQAGSWDVSLQIGPNYETQRQEAVAWMAEVGKSVPKIFEVAGSDWVRAMGGPGADKIADKLAMTEPATPQMEGDPQVALMKTMAQLKKTQQEAQALNVHAEQIEQAAQKLQDENATLKSQAAQKQIDLAIKQIELREAEIQLMIEQEKQATERLRLDVQREQAQTDRVAMHSTGAADGE